MHRQGNDLSYAPLQWPLDVPRGHHLRHAPSLFVARSGHHRHHRRHHHRCWRVVDEFVTGFRATIQLLNIG